MSEAPAIAISLSTCAKAVCGAWFGLMRPGKGELTFSLGQSRPSDQAQAGLDELVAAGIISVEAFNRYGGLVYRPMIDCHWALRWLKANINDPAAKIIMTAPLKNEREGKSWQRAVLRRAATLTPASAGGQD